MRVGYGLLYAQRKIINKRLVEQYLYSIGQIFASVGANNPRHNRIGKLDFRMGRQLEYYKKEGSTSTIMWHLPVSVIQVLDTATQVSTSRNIAIRNLN